MGAMQDMMGGQGGEEFPLVRVFYGGVATAKKPEVVIVPEEPWRLCITQVRHTPSTPPSARERPATKMPRLVAPLACTRLLGRVLQGTPPV